MSSLRHWEGGETCDASNESPGAKPNTFALLSQQEVVQRMRVVQKLFNVVLSKCHPRCFWYFTDFSWCNEDSENYCAVNEHIPQVLWIFLDTQRSCRQGSNIQLPDQHTQYRAQTRDKHIRTTRDLGGSFLGHPRK